MKVFKFGGASVSTIERISKVNDILRSYSGENILVVISAIGKTTNALEKVAEAFFDSNQKEALTLFERIKQQHVDLTKQIIVKTYDETYSRLVDIFTEAEWLLHDKPIRSYDYYYDQIVCTGELLSTCIMSSYFNENGIPNKWTDVRDILRTDDNFRDAAIDFKYAGNKISEHILPAFDSINIIVTQGFIGSTDENESTTLGREGSDYTAAVFANLLNGSGLSIWKDVEGVMNADPKYFPDAVFINHLNYDEVIEMAYYGAQVIHPKTIKPLQNKNIPLFVKCFLDPSLSGTVIHNKSLKGLPPIIVVKENQVMIELSSRDFSFVEEKPIADLFHLFEKLTIKPNLTQNAAISMICVLDDRKDKIEKLALAASEIFDINVTKGLTLLPIRHYTRDIYDKLSAGRKTLLQQRTNNTVQALLQ